MPIFLAGTLLGTLAAAQLEDDGRQALSLPDLADRMEIDRNAYSRMIPGTNAVLQTLPWQSFCAEDFPASFWSNLLGGYSNGVPVYPLVCALDPATLETRFYNVDGDPLVADETDFARADSSRILLQVPLVEEADAARYESAEHARLAAAPSASSHLPADGAGRDAPASRLAFTSIRSTNDSVVLELANLTGPAEIFVYALEHELSFRTNVWLNDENVLETNLVPHWTGLSPPLNGWSNAWKRLGLATAGSDGTAIYTNAYVPPWETIHFYAAVPYADEDGDGLSDGFELFVAGTSPTNPCSVFPGTQDGSLTNPATGHRMMSDQLCPGAEIDVISSKPGWSQGESIGWGGTVTLRFSDIDGQAIWLDVDEGGYTDEPFFTTSTNARMAYSNSTHTSGHFFHELIYVPDDAEACEIVIHDLGVVNGNIYNPDKFGADISFECGVMGLSLQPVESSMRSGYTGPCGVAVNADNDHRGPSTNGIPAARDFEVDNYLGEDDLLEFRLRHHIRPRDGASLFLLATSSGSGRIKVWETPQKAEGIDLPKTWDFGEELIPSSVYVEGLHESERLSDIRLRLAYLYQGSDIIEDLATLTVHPVLTTLSVQTNNCVPGLLMNQTNELVSNVTTTGPPWPAVYFDMAVSPVAESILPGRLKMHQLASNENLLPCGASVRSPNGVRF